MAYRKWTLTKKLALLILIAAAVSGLSFILLQAASNVWIERHVESDAYVKRKSAAYAAKLAEYVDANRLASSDQEALTAWIKKQRNLILMVYKDGELRYDSLFYYEGETTYRIEVQTDYMREHAIPVRFSDGMGSVIIDGFFSAWYFNLFFTIELLTATAIFLGIVLLGIRRSLAYLRTINDEIHILEGGELDYAMSVRGHDELAMIAESIEELRKAFLDKLQAIEALQEESRSLVTEMSHDLRTPLTSLIMYLEFAKKETAHLAPEANSHIVHIVNAYQKALQIKSQSDNLFAYFLLDKEQAVEPETLTVQEAIYDLVSDLGGVLQQEGFRLRMNGELPQVYITVNLEELGRVFDNLISNLLKYADPREEVVLSLDYAQGRLELRLSNAIRLTDDAPVSTGLGEKIMAKLMSRMDGEFDRSISGSTYTAILRWWPTKLS
ncbi:sensor histidine kinase [Paenibacillus sp. 598K]|uniref:sensor histidine kinase n=1 Tax=Paenibacillus sp. 598K TaxID=1117987 RepID=UPI000FFA8ACC|nr:HAMP domain-containing sensor histidine kinase [Paenibacillus sp. 598K]GBF74747.1 sensor histidine kinase [Paenibacillus sp. 598K]